METVQLPGDAMKMLEFVRRFPHLAVVGCCRLRLMRMAQGPDQKTIKYLGT